LEYLNELELEGIDEAVVNLISNRVKIRCDLLAVSVREGLFSRGLGQVALVDAFAVFKLRWVS